MTDPYERLYRYLTCGSGQLFLIGGAGARNTAMAGEKPRDGVRNGVAGLDESMFVVQDAAAGRYGRLHSAHWRRGAQTASTTSSSHPRTNLRRGPSDMVPFYDEG